MSLLSAEDFGYNLIKADDFNNNTAFVNASDWWVTNIGALSGVQSGQFNNVGNLLTIDSDYLDANWLALDGTNSPTATIDWNGQNLLMSGGNINMGNSSITNIFQLVSTDGSRIASGTNSVYSMFSGLDSAEVFSNNQTLSPGVITHGFLSTDPAGQKAMLLLQAGKNNSGGYWRNSMIIGNDTSSLNASILTDCLTMVSRWGGDARILCDSSDTGSDLVIQDDIQALGTGFFDGGIRAESLANFIMNGNDFQIQNGSLHILTPVTYETGVDAGQEVTIFQEFFSGGLGNFENIQDDVGNWFATSDIRCDDGDCAEAIGISGAGNIIMEANISTLNTNTTTLNFVYSLTNLIGADSFSVIVKNTTQSTTVFTDAGTDLTISESIDISQYDNQSLITIQFECDATQSTRNCFVDTVSVNGTAIETTLQNQSGFDSVISFSDGTILDDGYPERGIFYSAENDTIYIRGNVTSTTIDEVEINVTDNVTANNVIARQNFYLDGVKINDTFFRLDGNSVMQGNANFGNNTIYNVSDINVSNSFINGTGAKLCTNSECTSAWVVEEFDFLGNSYPKFRGINEGGSSLGWMDQGLFLRTVTGNAFLYFTDDTLTNSGFLQYSTGDDQLDLSGFSGGVNFVNSEILGVTDLTMSGNIYQGDNDIHNFGAANDLEIYHDGTDSQIINNNGDLILNNSLGSGNITLDGDVNVTGNITTTRLTISSTGNDDFAVYHDEFGYPGFFGSYGDFFLGTSSDPTTYFNYYNGDDVWFGWSGNEQNVTVFGNLTANYLTGDGSQLTNLPQQFNNPFDQSLNTTDNVTFNDINANSLNTDNITTDSVTMSFNNATNYTFDNNVIINGSETLEFKINSTVGYVNFPPGDIGAADDIVPDPVPDGLSISDGWKIEFTSGDLSGNTYNITLTVDNFYNGDDKITFDGGRVAIGDSFNIYGPGTINLNVKDAIYSDIINSDSGEIRSLAINTFSQLDGLSYEFIGGLDNNSIEFNSISLEGVGSADFSGTVTMGDLELEKSGAIFSGAAETFALKAANKMVAFGGTITNKHQILVNGSSDSTVANVYGLRILENTLGVNNYGISLESDNSGWGSIFWGAGQDMKQWFDGTDGNIDVTLTSPTSELNIFGNINNTDYNITADNFIGNIAGDTQIVGNTNITGNLTAEVISWGNGWITSNATCDYLRYNSTGHLKESECS
jgi:hypothetical protein